MAVNYLGQLSPTALVVRLIQHLLTHLWGNS
jgi:hypothetical protein